MKLPQKVNILLLGSGGREHAFAYKIAQSERTAQLYIAPGNAATSALGTNVDMAADNFGTIKQFVLAHNINLVVVGPELPLVKGISDFFKEDDELHNIPIVGPSALGAKLEGSKEFAKEFMLKHGVPTAAYISVNKDNIEEGFKFLDEQTAPYVLKADGLAAGKGVLILDSLSEAKAELESMLDGKFGAASATVVIEQCLKGIECSVFVATDGENFAILPEAKDYKRIGDGDTGLNTGGMGAVSPVPFADEAFMAKVREKVVKPTVAGFAKDEIDYKGFVFIGLMNDNGEPYVIEYNVRMGDPETEVVMPRIESDVVDMFEAMVHGGLGEFELKISEQTAITVVCVSGGYPEEYTNGFEISGLDDCGDESIVFHAGTVAKAGQVLTNGGRVLAVTSLGDSIQQALDKSYATIDKISYQGKYCRKDIGKDLM
ncbi:MAG: phosphoribosylamine--glycine ligase [Rikenellaceae bacterium]